MGSSVNSERNRVGSTCPLCNQTEAQELFTADDTYHIQRCQSCGFIFLAPRPPKDVLFSEYGEVHGWHQAKPSLRTKVRDKIWEAHGRYPGHWPLLRLLPRGSLSLVVPYMPQGRVLDVGFALGFLLDYFRSKRFETWGIEVSQKAIKRAQEQGHRAILADIEDMDTLEELPRQYFDVVVLNHVLEHLAEPAMALQNIGMLLKPGGYLIISVPNASAYAFQVLRERWYGTNLPHHLGFYTRETMHTLLEKRGYEITDTVGKHLLMHHPSVIRFYFERLSGLRAKVAFAWGLFTRTLTQNDACWETLTFYCRLKN